MTFEPDYRHILEVLANRKPNRLPLYEHVINPTFMEKILSVEFASLIGGNEADQREFFTHYCRFFKEMTYDTVSYEVCIIDIMSDHGAILGGRPGPIQNREDFEKYPWDELPQRYWEIAKPRFDMLARCLPPGMKAVGGVGNGVFEISEDLVGFEYLAYMMAEDPDLYSDLYKKIGDLVVDIWTVFLKRYTTAYIVCRFGDDLGFKTSTLISPHSFRKYILPQYRRVIDMVHHAGLPFLWHSCGNIFSIMDDVIDIGINAKHSNEDAIAPFDKWISLYGNRIGLLGGIDVDILCTESPAIVFDKVMQLGKNFRGQAKGFAIGSGNSIPDYVPVEGYLAMIQAAQQIRIDEVENRC